jgi:hypothetical protein
MLVRAPRHNHLCRHTEKDRRKENSWRSLSTGVADTHPQASAASSRKKGVWIIIAHRSALIASFWAMILVA